MESQEWATGKSPEPAGWPPSRRSGALARREGGKACDVSFFQNPSGVAASRQSAAVFAWRQAVGGALPRRRYGVLQLAHVARTFLSASSGDFPVPSRAQCRIASFMNSPLATPVRLN